MFVWVAKKIHKFSTNVGLAGDYCQSIKCLLDILHNM